MFHRESTIIDQHKYSCRNKMIYVHSIYDKQPVAINLSQTICDDQPTTLNR